MAQLSVEHAEIAEAYKTAITCEKILDELPLKMFQAEPAAALHMFKAAIRRMCKQADEIKAFKHEKHSL